MNTSSSDIIEATQLLNSNSNSNTDDEEVVNKNTTDGDVVVIATKGQIKSDTTPAAIISDQFVMSNFCLRLVVDAKESATITEQRIYPLQSGGRVTRLGRADSNHI